MNPITDNANTSRYEQTIDNHIVFADYRRAGSTLTIVHVEAPPALRGKGAAGAFMLALMEKLRTEGVSKIIPRCSYAAAWLARHKEYSDLL